MKDLYFRLGIEPQSSEQEIAAALESKPELGDCSSILLNPERRAQYDETHHIVKTIGMLRHRLGLDTGHSWFLENCPDFAPRNRVATHQRHTTQQPAEAQPRGERPDHAAPAVPPPKPEAHSSKKLPLALGIIGLVAVVLLLAWLMV